MVGLFSSLAPVFVSGQLHITSRATVGLVVFVTFTAAAAAQVGVRPFGVRARIALGTVLLCAGIVVLTVVVVTAGSLPAFVAGGLVCGAGGGTLFGAALAVAGALSDPAHRGEVLAGIFLFGYVGLTVPVVGIGVATLSVSLSSALIGFAVVIVAVALLASVPLLVALRPAHA